MEAISAEVFDVVVCDVRLPFFAGLAVLRRVHERGPSTYVILITAYAAVPDAVAALKRELGEARRLMDENADGVALVGRSPAMLRHSPTAQCDARVRARVFAASPGGGRRQQKPDRGDVGYFTQELVGKIEAPRPRRRL